MLTRTIWVSCSAYAEASADTVVMVFAFLPACGSQAGLHPRCSPPVGGSRGARRDSFLAKESGP